MCEVCNVQYHADKFNGSRQRFCSTKCRNRSNDYKIYQRRFRDSLKPIIVPITCETCGKTFQPNNYRYLTQRFCSHRCWTRSEKWLKYCRERQRSVEYQAWLRNHRRSLRCELMNNLGGAICLDCGSKHYDMLEIHHTNGDGKDDRKRFNSRPQFVRYYLDHIDEAKLKLSVLCGPCNRKRTRRY